MRNNKLSAVVVVFLLWHFFLGSFSLSSPYDGSKAAFPFIPVLAAPILVAAGYDIVTDRMVGEYEKKLVHDPSTECFPGESPHSLGPVDARDAVLLVHGFIGVGSNFNDLPDTLAENGYRVRVMLLPGHGTSPRDLEPVTPDSLVAAVREEIDCLKAHHETVTVIGHSMGGALATIAAAEGTIDRLVLCAPYFGVTYKPYYVLKPEEWADIMQPVIRWVPKTELAVQVNREEAKDDIVSYKWVSMRSIDMLMDVGDRAVSDDVLGRVNCPVLLLHGRDDFAASYGAARNALRRMASEDKKLVALESSNHQVFFDYDRELLFREITSFIGGVRHEREHASHVPVR